MAVKLKGMWVLLHDGRIFGPIEWGGEGLVQIGDDYFMTNSLRRELRLSRTGSEIARFFPTEPEARAYLVRGSRWRRVWDAVKRGPKGGWGLHWRVIADDYVGHAVIIIWLGILAVAFLLSGCLTDPHQDSPDPTCTTLYTTMDGQRDSLWTCKDLPGMVGGGV